jgi:catecholate siderophore receptor
MECVRASDASTGSKSGCLFLTGRLLVEDKARNSGIRSTARKPTVHAAIGLASAFLATNAVAQQTLPQIDVQRGGAAGRAVARTPPAEAPSEPAPASAAGAFEGGPANTLQTSTGLARIPGTVMDIPQTVNVITERTMREQGVTTVDQALRNVPGVTASSGEGGGGQNGDQFRIRGFQAKSDLYVDGLRDFGGYIRDSFSTEQVQVFKGPSSESFGYGTTGGAINLEQKKAKLGNFVDIEGLYGNGPYARSVVDINQQIDKTTAMRIVGMVHDQDIVGRDNLFSNRWGVLGSLGFGLGTSTTFTVNYMHQTGHRRPDMGTPIAQASPGLGLVGKPLPEFGVPRTLFYGKDTDNDKTSVDMFTARFKSEVTSWLTIYNDTRVAFYDRFFAQTATSCAAATCGMPVIGGNLNVNYTPGGPAGYDQSSNGAQNITTAVAKFHTGFLRHEFITGVDINQQEDQRFALTNSIPKVGGSILNPTYIYPGTVFVNPLGANTGIKNSESWNLGIFASDRVWLTEQFSLLGGARWDRFNSSYSRTGSATIPGTQPGVFIYPNLDSETEFVSPKASAIWEPNKQQMYYVSWAKSYSNLAGQYVALDNVAISNETLEPESNESWEAGLKWSMLDGKLGFTAALFQVTKGNSVQVDPVSGDLLQTNEKQRVKGVELGLTGKITEQWDMQVAYAYMDSEILSAPPAQIANIGNRVAFVPNNSASIWTTYNIAPMLQIPGKMLVGGGVFYTGQYFTNSASLAEVPEQASINLLASYERDKYRIALNVYNLMDEVVYDAAFGNRAVVGAGRTITLTGGVRW